MFSLYFQNILWCTNLETSVLFPEDSCLVLENLRIWLHNFFLFCQASLCPAHCALRTKTFPSAPPRLPAASRRGVAWPASRGPKCCSGPDAHAHLRCPPRPTLSSTGLTALSLLHLQAGGRHRAARSVLVRAVWSVRRLLLHVHPGPTAAVLQQLGSAEGCAHGQLGAAGWAYWGAVCTDKSGKEKPA